MSATGTGNFTKLTMTSACVAVGLFVFLPSTAFAQNRVGILGAGSCGFSDIVSAIAAAGTGATIVLEEGQVFNEVLGTINKDLTIRAGLPGCTGVSAPDFSTRAFIDGGLNDRIATIAAEVTLRQITVREGMVDDGGAGLLVRGTGDLTLRDAVVALNTNNGPFNPSLPAVGAGIHVQAGGHASLEGSSLVSGNINEWVGGGGILVEAGATVVLQDETQVLANIGKCCGGGVHVTGTLEMLDDAQVWGNLSDIAGGGIYVWGAGPLPCTIVSS